MSQRSNVWLHFKKSIQGGVCKYCNLNVKTSGNTTNLKNHMRRRHPNIVIVGKTNNSSNNVVSDYFQTEDSSSDDSESEVLASTPSTSTSSNTNCQTVQPTISSFVSNLNSIRNGTKAGELLNSIVYMIVKDDLPISTVEKEGFRHLMKTTVPLYKIPCRSTITQTINMKYDVACLAAKENMKNALAFTITTDIWTDTLNTQSYLGVTCHFINVSKKKLCSYIIAVRKLTERHDAQYLGETLRNICSEWEIDEAKIICITTDNASNIKKAVKDTFGEEKHLGCLAHTVNLIANKPFEKEDGVDDIKGLLSSIKEIVTFFKHSVVAADDLRKEQKNEESPLKLIQSVPTRWNSTYYQLERFLKLSNKVASVLLRHSRAPTMLNAYQMDIVVDLLRIFKPIERFSNDMSGENYSSGSLVIPLVNCLTSAIEKTKPKTMEGERTKAVILLEITKRFHNIENMLLLSISTILDPRFKKIHFKNPLSCASAIKMLKQLLCIVESQNSSIDELEGAEIDDSLWSYHKKLVENSNSLNSNNIGCDETKCSELRTYLVKPLLGNKTDVV